MFLDSKQLKTINYIEENKSSYFLVFISKIVLLIRILKAKQMIQWTYLVFLKQTLCISYQIFNHFQN